MPMIVACAHCRSRFNFADKHAGKRVKCPKCGEALLVAAEEDQQGAKGANSTAAKGQIALGSAPQFSARSNSPRQDSGSESQHTSSKRQPDDRDDDRPRRSRRQLKKQPKPPNMTLILGICAGAGVLLLLLFVGGITAVVVVSNRQVTPPGGIPSTAAPNPANPVPLDQAPPEPVNADANAVPVDAPPPGPMKAKGPLLQPRTKISVRAEIQGRPPDFTGDYNQHVTQNLEIALGQLGFEAVPQGGLILLVRAQLVDTGRKIKVREIGPGAMPKFKLGQPPAKVQQPQEQVYPVNDLTATLLLTNPQGTALWKKEQKFQAFVPAIFNGDPQRELQDPLWRAFDNWMRGSPLATLKQ